MKIHRSQLPADIAAALEPRTFAQERPSHGQIIEIKYDGKYERGIYRETVLAADSDFVAFQDGTTIDIDEEDASMLWKPILEIEDEAPEPAQERELPEPKRGSYFIVSGRLAYKSTGKECWRYRADEGGITKHEHYQLLAALPANWQPLSQVIEQAARAKELEAENKNLSQMNEDWTQLVNQQAAEIYELKAKLKQQDAEHRDELTRAESRESRLLERINDAFNALGGEL